MQIIRQKDIREFVELKKTICKLPSFTINSQKRKRIFSLFLETIKRIKKDIENILF